MAFIIKNSTVPTVIKFTQKCTVCELLAKSSLPQDGEGPIHHQLPPEHSDELTTHCQLILVMIQFGAYREVLGCEGAEPISEWAGPRVYNEDQTLLLSFLLPLLLLRVQPAVLTWQCHTQSSSSCLH